MSESGKAPAPPPTILSNTPEGHRRYDRAHKLRASTRNVLQRVAAMGWDDYYNAWFRDAQGRPFAVVIDFFALEEDDFYA